MQDSNNNEVIFSIKKIDVFLQHLESDALSAYNDRLFIQFSILYSFNFKRNAGIIGKLFKTTKA
jgi:hypothetical protein